MYNNDLNICALYMFNGQRFGYIFLGMMIVTFCTSSSSYAQSPLQAALKKLLSKTQHTGTPIDMVDKTCTQLRRENDNKLSEPTN